MDGPGYLALGRFQAAELSRAPGLAAGLADVVTAYRTVLVDRGEREFFGRRQVRIDYNLFMPIDLGDEGTRVAFLDELQNGPIAAARQQVLADGAAFARWIAASLRCAPPRRFPLAAIQRAAREVAGDALRGGRLRCAPGGRV